MYTVYIYGSGQPYQIYDALLVSARVRVIPNHMHDRMFGDFPAKNTLCTPYMSWPTLPNL